MRWLAQDSRLSYEYAPSDEEIEAREARLKKLIGRMMAAKQAHSEGEHVEAEDPFCPLCKAAKRADVNESAARAVHKMREAQQRAEWILRNPEKWAKLRAYVARLPAGKG
jgi:hypothetical protein